MHVTDKIKSDVSGVMSEGVKSPQKHKYDVQDNEEIAGESSGEDIVIPAKRPVRRRTKVQYYNGAGESWFRQQQ